MDERREGQVGVEGVGCGGAFVEAGRVHVQRIHDGPCRVVVCACFEQITALEEAHHVLVSLEERVEHERGAPVAVDVGSAFVAPVSEQLHLAIDELVQVLRQQIEVLRQDGVRMLGIHPERIVLADGHAFDGEVGLPGAVVAVERARVAHLRLRGGKGARSGRVACKRVSLRRCLQIGRGADGGCGCSVGKFGGCGAILGNRCRLVGWKEAGRRARFELLVASDGRRVDRRNRRSGERVIVEGAGRGGGVCGGGAAAYERRSQNDGCGALCERAGEGAHGSPSEKGKFELQYSVIPRAVPNAPSRVR